MSKCKLGTIQNYLKSIQIFPKVYILYIKAFYLVANVKRDLTVFYIQYPARFYLSALEAYFQVQQVPSEIPHIYTR